MNAKIGHGGGWNRHRAVGPRQAFTIQETQRISQMLIAQKQWHDLCLLALGLDSMLRASDLLRLRVGDVINAAGHAKTRISIRQQKTQQAVHPALTPATRVTVQKWVTMSGKEPHHFLFTGMKVVNANPITRGHYADRVKRWANQIGLNASDYSTHSIRRTKPRYMYQQGEDIAAISRLLGHRSIAVTLDYLQIEQDQADAATLRHAMVNLPPDLF